MKKQLHDSTHKENLQAKQELRILEESIIAARDFIYAESGCGNRYSRLWRRKCAAIPLYLILGPSRFGKTTMLSQAGLNLVDVHKRQFQEVHPTKYCSFWFGGDAIYIDTAGTYTKPDITQPRNDLIWQGFIKLLQKYFGKRALAGILVVLDLPAVTWDQDLLKRTLFCIRERVYEIAHLVCNMRMHVVFTKCDRIIGFREFFTFLDATERTQPFGIMFDRDKKDDLVQDFTTKFTRFLQRLHRRVIESVYQPKEYSKYALRMRFPAELNYLQPVLLEVISKIPHSNAITLSGIYFTSSIQDGAPLNLLRNVLSRTFGFKDKLEYSLEACGNYSHFIQGLFTQIVKAQDIVPVSQIVRRGWRWYLDFGIRHGIILLVVSLVLIFGAVLGYKNYNYNLDIIRRTDIALQLQADKGDNNAHTLYVLGEVVKQHAKSWWVSLGLNKVHTLSERLSVAHNTVFVEELVLQVESYINKLILTSGTVDAIKLYRVLAVYLMLGNPQKLDVGYVKSWMNQYWSELYGEGEKTEELLQQLDMVLQRGCRIVPNQYLVNAVRASLSNLPRWEQAYVLLAGSYPYCDLHLDKNRFIAVSSMYIKENFAKIYDDILPHINTHLPRQDWVWGGLSSKLQDEFDAETVIKLKEHYVVSYINMWADLFATATRVTFKDLVGAARYFGDIVSSDSSLEGLLRLMQEHTFLQDPPVQFQQQFDAKLSGINAINFIELQQHLREMGKYLDSVIQQTDSDAVSLGFLIGYFRNNLDIGPLTTFREFALKQVPFIQNYLMMLVNNIWQIIIDGAYKSITQAWNALVMPQYRSALENKYPVFKNSKVDISIDDFTRFFGPHGIIDSFFNRYIEPLVDIDKTNWQWKSVNKEALNFSPVFLELFLRAALIQKMFYANKIMTPHLEFTLTPVSMTSHTQSFTLYLEGQQITTAEQRARTLVWPGSRPGVVTLSFVDVNGKYSTVTELGAWAWFKILDKANVTSHRGTKDFYITFEVNNSAAKYILASNEAVNPFIPEVISNSRCYEQ